MDNPSSNKRSVTQNFQEHYGELRRMAGARLYRENAGWAINATALVNECFLKLQGVGSLESSQRTSFLAYASHTMRSIIVDLARAELAQRRGGGASVVALDTELADALPDDSQQPTATDVLAIDQALTAIEAMDPRLAQVVELRYFAGMTFPEVAEVLGVNERTVHRDWTKARMLLLSMLSPTQQR
jgi:RNA polymerase sigma factor (TIGR02999 family)